MAQTSSKSSAVFALAQRVGQALMVPVSVLPAAGLLVALGRVLQGSGPPSKDPALMEALGRIAYSGGLAIFEQLPVVFAVGVAIGFTGGAGVAGLAAVAGYFTLTNVLKAMGEVRGLEAAINMGVFGGIIVGILSAAVYKRFHQTRLPQILGFFAGKRLVPILTCAFALVVGLAFAFVWPPIQNGIHAFGNAVVGSEWGPALYAAGKRALIPVGLHHVYYPSFLFEFGEFTNAAGQVVRGESARYYAGDPTAGGFMASEFPIMLFGLPAAALAMTLAARPERRKAVGGVMMTAALTSILTGITEPVEFAFIFVAPLLYVFHVLAAFVSGVLTHWAGVRAGYTFSASLIDLGVGKFNAANLGSLLWIGPLIGVAYFGAFTAAIRAFNFMTPGRDVNEDSLEEAPAPASGAGRDAVRAAAILEALGGPTNLSQLDACITRLRVTVRDASRVKKDRFKALGAAGVMEAKGGNFQIVFGAESEFLKDAIRGLIAGSATAMLSPLSGQVVALDQIPDETFSKGIMGSGFGIDPSEGILCAPFAGEIINVFRTGHAVGMLTTDGLEVLLHVGIDTVKGEGRGFTPKVKVGDQVVAGQTLVEFDLPEVRKHASSMITPVIFTNPEKISRWKVTPGATVKHGGVVGEMKLK